MKILSFGHLPTWAGGQQEQGLANVIYNLALNMSRMATVDIKLAATDVFVEKLKVENLEILGWTKRTLLIYAILNPFLSIRYIISLFKEKFKHKHNFSILNYFFKGLHLHRSIVRTNPHLLHLHCAHSLVFLPIIPQKIKIVLTIHGTVGNDPEIEYHNEYAIFEKELCHCSRIQEIYFIASSLVKEFEDSYNGIEVSTKTILNAYNSDKFFYIEPIKHKNVHLCTIATIQPRKGQCRVVEALTNTNLDYLYSCIGAGDDNQIHLLTQSKCNLQYLGKMTPDEIRCFMAKVDYMILPSSSEGFGLVFLEAIACGVPVILPKDLPIVQEENIIKPGINAILLEDCSASAIANLLPKLNEYNFNRKDVANSIVNYTWSNIAKQYIDCFEQILK